ncbi:MAG: hypothetical protein ABJE47_24365 [bacterium]
MNAPDWRPLFDYLEHEAKFQAAVGTVTGAGAAWWLKALLAQAKDSVRPTYPRASRLAAALLALSSYCCFLEQGRLSKKYGELAVMLASGVTPSADWTEIVVRGRWQLETLVQWSPYYAARALLFAVGAIVLWMLYRDSKGG